MQEKVAAAGSCCFSRRVSQIVLFYTNERTKNKKKTKQKNKQTKKQKTKKS